MGDSSNIEWTDATWNPIAGCSKVSPGCDNCYAIRDASRLAANPHQKIASAYQGTTADGDWTGRVNLLGDRLDQPLRWTRPRRIFVNSMSDLFHPEVPNLFVGSVWATMAKAHQHVFQILTKRPQRMSLTLREWSEIDDGAYGGPMWRDHEWRWNESPVWPLPNVWLGTSIESNRYTFRAEHLRRTPAAVRWLSLEPLLGPLPDLDLTGIDWVVAGGESGPGARPMHPDWVRDIRDRCVDHGVAFHFKQWGRFAPASPVYPDWDDQDQVDVWDCLIDYDRLVALEPGGAIPQAIDLDGDYCDYQPGIGSWWMAPVGKKQAGRLLDGRTWDEWPAMDRTHPPKNGPGAS